MQKSPGLANEVKRRLNFTALQTANVFWINIKSLGKFALLYVCSLPR